MALTWAVRLDVEAADLAKFAAALLKRLEAQMERIGWHAMEARKSLEAIEKMAGKDVA